MKPFTASSLFERLREAANKASREMGPSLGFRVTARFAAAVGDELALRIAAMTTRDQLDTLREVLTPEQFALATQLYDALHGYAQRASVTASSTPTRVSSIN